LNERTRIRMEHWIAHNDHHTTALLSPKPSSPPSKKVVFTQTFMALVRILSRSLSANLLTVWAIRERERNQAHRWSLPVQIGLAQQTP
jgi:hypothetical protein